MKTKVYTRWIENDIDHDIENYNLNPKIRPLYLRFYTPSNILATFTTAYYSLSFARALSLASNYPFYNSHWPSFLLTYDASYTLPIFVGLFNYTLL